MVAAIGREVWQDPAKPVTGPARRDEFEQGVIHWEGDNAAVPLDVAAYLRQMQAGYLADRDYSLGYCYAVVSQSGHPLNGTKWEIRGTDINPASNPGDKWNDMGLKPAGNTNYWTGSVLIMGRPAERATEEAAIAVRSIFAEWHDQEGTPYVRPRPHNDFDYTQCCGNPYRLDIMDGRFDPAFAPKPPDPKPLPEDDDMTTKLILKDTRTPFGRFYLCDGNTKTWIDNGNTLGQLGWRIVEALGVKPDYTKPAPAIPANQPLTPPNPLDGFRYAVLSNGDPNCIASYGPIVGPKEAGVDQYGR